MQTVAFAHGYSDAAGEQADRATEDVQNQERESQASTSFGTCHCGFACEIADSLVKLRIRL
jgi:hypothetical protein